jgi:hypothetical protein
MRTSMDSIYWQVKQLATWPVVALLLVVAMLCSLGFERRKETFGYANPPLDSRWPLYTPEDARILFHELENRGQLRLYGITEVTLDLIFPFVYGTLFAALLINVYDRTFARWLVLLPLLAAVADLMENSLIAVEAFRFNGETSSLISMAAMCTATKGVLLLLVLVVLATGAVRVLLGIHH